VLEISLYGMEEILARLQAIQERSGNLRPLMREIGEDVVESTKQRFITTTSPDGDQWLLNTPATLLATDKDGNLRKEGDTPLTNHGNLARYIHYTPLGNEGVEIGTNAVQAAMMQFGGTKAEFGRLWGDIPARPFLGLSDDDKQNILDLTLDYLL
jgi:phage virion morphogenesis protein